MAMAYHRTTSPYGTVALVKVVHTTLWESISGSPAGCAVKNRELLYCKMQVVNLNVSWGCVGARKHMFNGPKCQYVNMADVFQDFFFSPSRPIGPEAMR